MPAFPPQQRALLAVLLLRRGREARAPELIHALWGDEPPNTALSALRTYASRIRKSFGPHANEALVSVSGNYAIRVEDGALDLDLAEDHAARAEEAKRSREYDTARQLLDAALDLWGGESLAGVPGPYVQGQRTRFEEWRLQLIESRLELDLNVGRHAAAVSELTALVAAHPLRERLRGLLMLALYRSGRQAEALAVHSDTRHLFAQELGVAPSPRFAELHQRILASDTALAAPEARAGSHTVTLPSPAQLPADVEDFTGRAGVARELLERLTTDTGGVTVVAGAGGVGKTTSTVHAAHAARDHFPDGQLYIDLQGGRSGSLEPCAVLGSFLRALGTPDSGIPESTAERAALYRSLLHGRRVVVVLDNARDAAQVRPLLPGAKGCATLINSRRRMVEPAGAHLVDLDVMDPQEALELFTKIVGEPRATLEPGAALEVVTTCGFLPLAIRIAGRRLATRPTWTVSQLALRVADKRQLLDELRADDLAVAATFELSYSQLDPQQARAFRLLGLSDIPDVSLHAAAAMLDLDTRRAETLLESLVDVSLLDAQELGRYRYHDLVRLYARSRAESGEEPPAQREAALTRLLDFYLATVAHVYAWERPGQSLPVEHTGQAGMTFRNRAEAAEWKAEELHCLLACISQLTADTQLRKAADLLRFLSDLADDGSHSRQFEQAGSVLLEASRTAGDVHAQGRVEVTLTWIDMMQGRFNEAEVHARTAEQLGTEAEDSSTVATSRNDLGIISTQHQQYEEAEAYFHRALDGFRANGNEPAEASALCNLSRMHLATGRYEQATDLAERGVAIYRRTGASLRLGNALYQLGMALTYSGSWKRAEGLFADAHAIFQDCRHQFWSAMTHYRLAELHLKAHDPDEAAHQAERALSLRNNYGGLWCAKILTVLGQALTALGQNSRGRACWEEALPLFQQLGAADAEQLRALLAARDTEAPAQGRPGS
nr:BTAD domain-containing putative transcriptional regulator [Streptomyces albidus (ex Kaewkla and Franco 2022)]